MNELNKLLGSTYAWASQRAQDAINIKQAFDSNQITQAQATEMLQNLIDTDQLNAVASDFTTKTTLITAINDLISVISSVPGI